MKKFARVLSVALALTLFLSACNNTTTDLTKNEGSDKTESTSGDTGSTETGEADKTDANESDTTKKEDGEGSDGPVHQDKKHYTYSEAWGAGPATWSPHTWETNADSGMMMWIDTGLVNPIYDEETETYAWQYEAATEIKDITADFKDKEKWGIEKDAKEQLVYQIDLNPEVKWEDGTEINADSYIYSMQQLLDSKMKNYRANTYYSGSLAIRGAAGYYNNDKAGTPNYVDTIGGEKEAPADAKLFTTMDEPVYFLGDSAKELYEDYKDKFTVNKVDLYEKYKGKGYIEVTPEVQKELEGLALAFGDDNPDAWKEFTLYADGTIPETKWEDVGLVKTGDYQFIYILEQPLSEFYFLTNMGSATWLVHEKLYEAGKKTVEGLTATNYFTTKDTTMSYGPYKLVSFEKDKQFILERNEDWFGYKDEKYDKQWMADTIRVEIISDHNTELQLFNQGQLDSVALDSKDLETYRMSDYLMTTEQTYTNRWIFATDPTSLKALEDEAGDGANKQVLQYDEFRKALSLSINRDRFTQEGTPGWNPAYFLLNNLYYYDIENNPESQYRKSEPAMDAVLRLYGIEYGEGKQYPDIESAYEAVTGYDVEEAKKLFQEVYEKAIKEKTYKDGQPVNINVMATKETTLSADLTKQQDILNDFVTEATKGTGFEGKVTIKFEFGSADRYGDVAKGNKESIFGAWGGAAFYPFSTIRVYCEPDYMGGLEKIHESNGFNPVKEKFTIKYDFDGDGKEEETEDTFQNWAKSINGDGKYANDPEKALIILSHLESNILGAYSLIPLATQTSNTLHSMQIEYITYTYDLMYAYGGIRQMSFNYDDDEWEAFVKEQGGTLSYE